jgi:hypothetical protein
MKLTSLKVPVTGPNHVVLLGNNSGYKLLFFVHKDIVLLYELLMASGLVVFGIIVLLKLRSLPLGIQL